MRTRSGFGVVLNCKQRELSMTNSLDGSIIQIEVSDLEARGSRNLLTISNYREAMILGCDEHLVVAQIADRMISSPMAVRQLGGTAAVRQSDQLVPQADSECREPRAGQLADGTQSIAHGGRISRTIGKKEPIGL